MYLFSEDMAIVEGVNDETLNGSRPAMINMWSK
jgi:hypothetical protein